MNNNAAVDDNHQNLDALIDAWSSANFWDQHNLREDTQRKLIAVIVEIGRRTVLKENFELPALVLNDIADAARHFGNDILGQSGSEQVELMRSILHNRDTYAAKKAQNIVDTALRIWYVDQAVVAYKHEAEEFDDEDLGTRLFQVREDLERVCSNYYANLRTETGITLLWWLEQTTGYLSAQRALLPPDQEVPLWLNWRA